MSPRSMCVVSLMLVTVGAAGCQNSGAPEVAERRSTPASTVTASPVVATATATSVAAAEPKATATQGSSEAVEPAERFAEIVPRKRKPQEVTLVATPVTGGPTIDGRADDPMWASARAVTTLDYSSQREITLKSVVTRDEVFFLVTFPDATASETHKTWVWDPKEEVYREGPDREDVFLFKWSMSGNGISLRLDEPEPHRGDIWFWKARRTNPSGYADDKWQGVSLEPGPQAKKIPSKKYGSLYFRRVADEGEPAFDEKFLFEYQGDKMEKYVNRKPEGSRADVRAKGMWANGQWTIEFGRKLKTGHEDDTSFAPGGTYLFAVSCYAMALDTAHGVWSQPLYRTGDVFDRLLFTIPSRVQK